MLCVEKEPDSGLRAARVDALRAHRWSSYHYYCGNQKAPGWRRVRQKRKSARRAQGAMYRIRLTNRTVYDVAAVRRVFPSRLKMMLSRATHVAPGSSSRRTVELIKLVSARFTEFLQRILEVQIGPLANFLCCQIRALVRFNNIFDCVLCGLNDLLRCF